MFEELYPWIREGMPKKDFGDAQLNEAAKLIQFAVTQPKDVVNDALEKTSRFCTEKKLLGKPDQIGLQAEELQQFFRELLEILKRDD